mgnify:CR=1 FL=1
MKCFGFKICEKEGFEADDLIASYTRLAVEGNARVTIISPDKDLYQLVSHNVVVRSPSQLGVAMGKALKGHNTHT